MKLFGTKVSSDHMVLESGSDGSYGPCYFCGDRVIRGSDFAMLMVERVDPKGEPIHTVCHGNCAERARHV